MYSPSVYDHIDEYYGKKDLQNEIKIPYYRAHY